MVCMTCKSSCGEAPFVAAQEYPFPLSQVENVALQAFPARTKQQQQQQQQQQPIARCVESTAGQP
jgi:hypothetical protein